MRFAYIIEPPFNFRDENGLPAGCDVDLARVVLSAVGYHDVEFVEAEFPELLPGLVDGRWEMTTGLFATEERRQSASFSKPIWALPDGLLVKRGNPDRLWSYGAIVAAKRSRLAVIRDQVQHLTALQCGIPENRIAIFETYSEAALAVADGTVDAYASVARAHAAFTLLNPEMPLETVDIPRCEKEPAFGSFAFSKTRDGLRVSVNAALTS